MQYEKHFSHVCKMFKSKVSFISEGYIADVEIKLMNNTDDACLSHTNYIYNWSPNFQLHREKNYNQSIHTLGNES